MLNINVYRSYIKMSLVPGGERETRVDILRLADTSKNETNLC